MSDPIKVGGSYTAPSQPTREEVEVARQIVRANCHEAALLDSDKMIVQYVPALTKAIASALHSAHSRAVEEAAKATCGACERGMSVEYDNGTFHHPINKTDSIACHAAVIRRALSVKDEKNQDSDQGK